MSFLTYPILEILSYFTSFFDKSIFCLMKKNKKKDGDFNLTLQCIKTEFVLF